MFHTILIANRGEIACRVMRSAQAMGIKCVAVYSDADADAPHVRQSDMAVNIGPAPAAQSYLVGDKIQAAAKETGAQAIHPGYGFLSENADFAEACEAAGIVFIGPSPTSMRAMASKSAAKDLMEAAGVPTLKGYQGDDQSLATFKAEAKRIGYPVLLKATAGGGGKGMRIVEKASELEDALNSARREAKSAFGDDRFLVEKYLAAPRHVEVQVFGDSHGNIVHLFERDCSVQRRHQKVLEEAPAPNLSADVRAQLLKAGVDAARAVDYIGAGTVEFLYDGQDGVYFMEMNTRLQVEHPVTEEITGIDLVEWQLLVAAGEPLPLAQDQITCSGHAIEARLYAEAPERDFAPSIGELSTLQLPSTITRVDSGVEQGQVVSANYDPMIAKIIAKGRTRIESLNILARALEITRVAGLDANTGFLHRLTQSAPFRNADLSTRLIADNEAELLNMSIDKDAALTALAHHLVKATPQHIADISNGWRLNAAARQSQWGMLDDQIHELAIEGDMITLGTNSHATARRDGETPDTRIITQTPALMGAIVVDHLDGWRIFIGAQSMDVSRADPLAATTTNIAGGGLTAPLPGIVTALGVEPGAHVDAGVPLVVMEAMKMEHTLKAPAKGVVNAYRFGVGDQVGEGDLLVDFTPDE